MCGMREIDDEIELVSKDEKYSDAISRGILPSLGANSNRRVKLRRFIISPFEPRYRYAHLINNCFEIGNARMQF